MAGAVDPNRAIEGASDRTVRMVEISGKAAFVLVLVTGIVVPGVMNYVLSVIVGRPILGRIVWVLGYTLMIGVIWYGWLRPLDFEGPEHDSDEAERKVKD